MMGKIFCFLFVAALLFGGLGGRMGEVAAALPQGAGNAVQLVLSIAGTICVWSGVMEVMDQSGLTKKISRALSPVIKALFGRQGQDPEARDALSQNMAANLLGLGSAATPAACGQRPGWPRPAAGRIAMGCCASSCSTPPRCS